MNLPASWNDGMHVARKPRVMIYGVGLYGTEAVRILARKGWPIVAAVNRAGPKIGQDLGRLAGFDEDLGVKVQDCEVADYAALGACPGKGFPSEGWSETAPMGAARLL